jgi:PST family polysaccharide transporter
MPPSVQRGLLPAYGSFRSLLGVVQRAHLKFTARPSAQNFVWLIADRGLRLAIGVLVSSWSARYLGVANFGLLNYALALVAIFAGIIPLGMDGLVVREIIRNESAAGQWVGTVMGFRGMVATLCAGFSIVGTMLIRPGDAATYVATLKVVTIFAICTIAQSMESGELLFQARIQMRRLILPRLGLFFVMNVMKIGLIVMGMSVFWFAMLTGLEMVVSGTLTLIFVRRALGKGNPLGFSFSRGWKLLHESWPLALSGLAVIIYMKVGMVIVGKLLGDAALGIYAAGIRIPDSGNFIPMVLASSLLPSLIKNRELGPEAYEKALMRFFRINVLIALAVCIPITVGAPWIVNILFHRAYDGAIPVMMIYVWSFLFVFLGVARTQYLLNERLTKLSLLFSVVGLIVNLVCNFLFIPRFGVVGAAAATVVSQMGSAFLASFIVPATRRLARLQALALVTPWMIF